MPESRSNFTWPRESPVHLNRKCALGYSLQDLDAIEQTLTFYSTCEAVSRVILLEYGVILQSTILWCENVRICATESHMLSNMFNSL